MSSSPRRVEVPWWTLPEGGACNLAVTDLVHNFPTRFRQKDGRIHAPTMLSGLGGATGYAAQMALRSLIASGIRTAEGLSVRTLADGRRFTYGDPLNNILVQPDPNLCSFGLWAVATGPVLQAGIRMEDLPDLGSQFGTVTQRLGSPDEGFPNVPDAHRPALPTAALMRSCWPLTRMILDQSYPGRPGPLGPVPPRLWPTVTAWAASTLLKDTLTALDPVAGLKILIEAAIYGSKLEPQAFE